MAKKKTEERFVKRHVWMAESYAGGQFLCRATEPTKTGLSYYYAFPFNSSYMNEPYIFGERKSDIMEDVRKFNEQFKALSFLSKDFSHDYKAVPVHMEITWKVI